MSSSGIDNARAKDGAGRVRSTAGTFVSATETTETTDRLQRDFESLLSLERVPLLVDATEFTPPTGLGSDFDGDEGDDRDELVIAPRLGRDELLDFIDEKPGKGTSELVSTWGSSVDQYWEPSRWPNLKDAMKRLRSALSPVEKPEARPEAAFATSAPVSPTCRSPISDSTTINFSRPITKEYDAEAQTPTFSQHGLPPRKRSRSLRRFRFCCSCTPLVVLYSVMIGTIVSLFLVLYAWNVETLWTSESMRGGNNGLGQWRPADLPGGNSSAGAGSGSGGVKRRWLHSHNDEMRGKDAMTLALSLGFGSIEVDTWLGPTPNASSATSTSASRERGLLGKRSLRQLFKPSVFDDSYFFLPMERRGLLSEEHAQLANRADATPDPRLTLLTGHKVKDVTSHTVEGLYLAPLLARLDANNANRKVNESVIGVYADDPSAEVQLVVDMKSDGDMTWPYLLSALQPFLEKGYLTTYDPSTSTWSRSALLIIGTGNTPLHHVYHQSPRVIFYDAPLKPLSQPTTIPETSAGPAATFEYDNTISPMASAKFPPLWHVAAALPPWNPIIKRLRGYTSVAAEKGMSSRWWGAAKGPGWIRRRMWLIMMEGGATWVNADKLREAEGWLNLWEGVWGVGDGRS